MLQQSKQEQAPYKQKMCHIRPKKHAHYQNSFTAAPPPICIPLGKGLDKGAMGWGVYYQLFPIMTSAEIHKRVENSRGKAEAKYRQKRKGRQWQCKHSNTLRHANR